MFYLLIVSVIWSFSFGLIKGNLAGLDSHFVSFIRLLISMLFFIPFMQRQIIKSRLMGRLMLAGGVQFGVMYICYIYSYNFLKAWQVALFTIFTPIYVTFISDLFEKEFHPRYAFAALLAIAGSAVIVYKDLGDTLIKGFLLIQLSNICFGFGQVYYKKVKSLYIGFKDGKMFFWMYAGAVLVSGLNSAVMTNWKTVSLNALQIWTLLYLGILASGISFFLWNYGATKVNNGTLAVFNNLKVPLGVFVAIVFFGESGSIKRLLLGGLIILVALIISEYKPRTFESYFEISDSTAESDRF